MWERVCLTRERAAYERGHRDGWGAGRCALLGELAEAERCQYQRLKPILMGPDFAELEALRWGPGGGAGFGRAWARERAGAAASGQVQLRPSAARQARRAGANVRRVPQQARRLRLRGRNIRSERKSGPEVPARRLVLTPASEIEPEPVVWAWEDDGAGRIRPGRSACSPAGRAPAKSRS